LSKLIYSFVFFLPSRFIGFSNSKRTSARAFISVQRQKARPCLALTSRMYPARTANGAASNTAEENHAEEHTMGANSEELGNNGRNGGKYPP
jgi:hypothetical protein